MHYKLPGHTDLFVPCTLSQKVIGQTCNLEYEIWVTLSEENFQDYTKNYNFKSGIIYSGKISNNFLPYENTNGIPVRVILKNGIQGPELKPNHHVDHEFVLNFYTGITKIEAVDRIAEIQRFNNEIEKTNKNIN